MNLIRQKDESILDFKIRLCKNKDTYGLTWETLKDVVNKECSLRGTANSYRKWWRRCNRNPEPQGYDNEIAIQSMNELSEMDSKLVQFDIEKKKKQTVATLYNQIIREEARRQMLFEEFRHSIQSVTPPSFNRLPISNGSRDCILGLADIHYGKIFESVNNKYDESIALSRMETIMNETIDFCKKQNLDHVHVVNAGDSIEGMALRISQLNSLEFGFVEMVVRFQRMMVEWLNELSRYLKVTYHHVPSANHTEIRPLGTKAGQFPAEDMEKLMMIYIHDMLKENNRIDIPEYKSDYARFDAKGYLFYVKHGHQIKNLRTYIRDLSILHREFIDYLLCAHFHHTEVVNNNHSETSDCELLMLPSVMGSDEYSDSLLTGSKPGAKIFVVEEGKGKNLTYDIRLN